MFFNRYKSAQSAHYVILHADHLSMYSTYSFIHFVCYNQIKLLDKICALVHSATRSVATAA